MPVTAVASATMNKREAAAYLKVSVRTLDRLDIPRVRLANSIIRYRKATLDAHLATNESK
jgi:hypothetical protein